MELEIKIANSIDDMIEIVKRGEADLIAFNLTVTKERQETLAFAADLSTTHQVLIQRNRNWRDMNYMRLMLLFYIRQLI